MITKNLLKKQTIYLKSYFKEEKGIKVGSATIYEPLSKIYGEQNWNILSAKLNGNQELPMRKESKENQIKIWKAFFQKKEISLGIKDINEILEASTKIENEEKYEQD